MPTNDKFIQSIIELLDKVIDYQSRNSNLLTEIKSSVSEVRNETTDILVNLREKLPNTLSDDQEENYRRLFVIINKIEDNNERMAENIRLFEQNYGTMKVVLDRNHEILDNNSKVLQEISKSIIKREQDQNLLLETVKDVNLFIQSLRSKKAWVALMIAGIAALATMLSAIAGGAEAIREYYSKTKPSTTINVQPANPVTPTNP